MVVIGVILLGTSTLAGINTSLSEKNETSVLPTKQPLSQNGEYDMVIIAPELFSAEIQRLVEHKNAVGIRTFSKTTEEIYNEYNGRDEPEIIKYFIKDSVETYGIQYVLLVGDIKYLPIRISYIRGSPFWKRIPTDLYYADLYKLEGDMLVFEDWDSNGNGIKVNIISRLN